MPFRVNNGVVKDCENRRRTPRDHRCVTSLKASHSRSGAVGVTPRDIDRNTGSKAQIPRDIGLDLSGFFRRLTGLNGWAMVCGVRKEAQKK